MAFARLYDWTDDRDNGVKIMASRFDDEMDRLTSNDNLLADSQPQWGGTDTGTASAFAVTVSPTPAALKAGQVVRWIAGRDNNGPTATLNNTALGAKPIKMAGTVTIGTAAILSGAMYESVYDGSAQYTHRMDAQDQSFPTLYVTGTADLLGPLTTIGDATADRLVINAAASAQSVFAFANAVTFASSATFNGSVTLGDATADTLKINAETTAFSPWTHEGLVTFDSAAVFNGPVTIGDATADTLKINAETTAESPWTHNNAVTFNSAATFNANVTIGNATADALKINAETTAFSPWSFLNAVTFGSSTTFTGGAGALRSKVITFTRDMTAASGSVGYTGAGFVPTSVIILGTITNALNLFSLSLTDSALNMGVLFANNSATIPMGTAAIAVALSADGSVTSQQGSIASYDSNGFTITWTKNGVPSAGTATLYALCLR